MTKPNNSDNATFWQHLDALRMAMIKGLVAWLACTVAMFMLKKWLFVILFAPSSSDFILYRALRYLARLTGLSAIAPAPFSVSFINTQLTAQFMTHIQVAMLASLVVVAPYLIFLLFGFVSPALYQHERHLARQLTFVSCLLFYLGIALNYFLIFPLSFRFLADYQVSQQVVNQIALSSYISTFLLLSLLMGLMFQLPVIVSLLARLSLISAQTLRTYRRHVFVAILIFAAIITPTADPFTLLIVTLPIYLLYELSIIVVSRREKHLHI